MPSPAKPHNEKVELKINDQIHSEWESYEIDSDLLIPADGWHVALGLNNGKVPTEVVVGMLVNVLVGGEVVLTGYVDDIDHPIGKAAHPFSMTGRDLAADLVDCSAPIFSAKMVGLQQIIKMIVSSFGLTKTPSIDAEDTRIREKINIEPGDTAWDALARVAEANGLWPWFEPDGTLVVGGPDYSSPIVAHLIIRKSGKGNNALSINKHESMIGRYSDVTVLGQAHGTDTEPGRHSLRAGARDTDLSCTTRYRPKIVTDHECDSVAVCRDRARKLIADGRLNGLTLTVEVKGHRIVAPGTEFDGLLWKPGMRVMVTSEAHNIKEQIFFMMARKFKRSRSDGTRSVLTLKEDGIWIMDAHPHKNTHRRGKNGPGQIIDVSPAK